LPHPIAFRPSSVSQFFSADMMPAPSLHRSVGQAFSLDNAIPDPDSTNFLQDLSFFASFEIHRGNIKERGLIGSSRGLSPFFFMFLFFSLFSPLLFSPKINFGPTKEN